MTGRQRCDEILRLIDEALMDAAPSDVAGMATRVDRPVLTTASAAR